MYRPSRNSYTPPVSPSKKASFRVSTGTGYPGQGCFTQPPSSLGSCLPLHRSSRDTTVSHPRPSTREVARDPMPELHILRRMKSNVNTVHAPLPVIRPPASNRHTVAARPSALRRISPFSKSDTSIPPPIEHPPPPPPVRVPAIRGPFTELPEEVTVHRVVIPAVSRNPAKRFLAKFKRAGSSPTYCADGVHVYTEVEVTCEPPASHAARGVDAMQWPIAQGRARDPRYHANFRY